jgi:energy-coupling factor transport system substrate-specific component
MNVRLIAFNAVFAAALFGIQVALSGIANIEAVSLCVLAAGIVFGMQMLPGVLVFAFLEGLLYGFSWWTISYLYVWPLLLLTGKLLHKERNAFFLACVSGIFGLLFGSLCGIVMLIPLGFQQTLVWIGAGLWFDVIHAAGNFVIALLLIKQVIKLFETIKSRSRI